MTNKMSYGLVKSRNVIDCLKSIAFNLNILFAIYDYGYNAVVNNMAINV